ncbi:hypothetical protein [Actinoplanes sp. M2I2]|uniref:hypothetical protein n=1 Tax=Actinoplanes sp. M2I2 TaxID=1734444 RepID=UPI0020206B92|nr:hypothetical protein [Actinoplanes sp. M2I2]
MQAQHTATTRHLHQLLGSLHGRLCGGFVADLRSRLTGGHVVEVAHAVVFAAVAEAVALTDSDIDLLIATLAGHGEDTAMAETIKRAGRARPPLSGSTPSARALVRSLG